MAKAYFDSDNNFIYEDIDLSNLASPGTGSAVNYFVLPTYHNTYVQHTAGSVIATVDMDYVHSDETNPWADTLPLLNDYGGAPQPLNLKLPYVIEDDGTTVKWCRSKIALFMCVRKEGNPVSGYKWRAVFLFYKGYVAYHSPTSGSIQSNGCGVYYSNGVYYQSYASHGEWRCKEEFSSREDLIEWMQNVHIDFPVWKVYDNNEFSTVDNVHRNSQAGADMDDWLLSLEGWDMTDNWNKPFSILDTINAYFLTTGKLSKFRDGLWQLDADQNVKFSNSLYSNPMECILGIGFMPFPTTNNLGEYSPIVVGLQTLQDDEEDTPGMEGKLCSTRIGNEFLELDFGTKKIPHLSTDPGYGDCGEFGDYRDFTETQCEIYLPCIGWHTLNSEEVVGRDLTLKYRINFVTGDVIAVLSINGLIIDSVPGNALQQIPYSGRDMTGLVAAQTASRANAYAGMGSLLALGAATVTGNVPLGLASFAGIIGAGVQGNDIKNNVQKAQNNVQKSGSIGGSTGIMGHPTPYIVIHRHSNANPTGWVDYIGESSHKIVQVGTLTGYVKTKNFRFADEDSTKEEIDNINALMDGGVII